MAAAKTIKLRSTYLRHAVEDPDKVVELTRTLLKGKRYDTLVGTGLSGALIVPHVARALGKHWMIVRKENDGSHAWWPVEGELGKRWVFLDDLVDTGTTQSRVKKVISQIADERDFKTTYVGTVTYNEEGFEAA